MKQFTLNLVENSQRPVVKLKNWKNIRVLLDTGAVFPVWTKREELLLNLGVKPLNRKVLINGFGGVTECNVYTLERVCVGDLIYPSLPVAVCPMSDMPFQLILPATMFSGLMYEIDDCNHKLNVTIPNDNTVRNLRIEDSNGHIYVLCSSERNSKK